MNITSQIYQFTIRFRGERLIFLNIKNMKLNPFIKLVKAQHKGENHGTLPIRKRGRSEDESPGNSQPSRLFTEADGYHHPKMLF